VRGWAVSAALAWRGRAHRARRRRWALERTRASDGEIVGGHGGYRQDGHGPERLVAGQGGAQVLA
jgi:hypothetical protein